MLTIQYIMHYCYIKLNSEYFSIIISHFSLYSPYSTLSSASVLSYLPPPLPSLFFILTPKVHLHHPAAPKWQNHHLPHPCHTQCNHNQCNGCQFPSWRTACDLIQRQQNTNSLWEPNLCSHCWGHHHTATYQPTRHHYWGKPHMHLVKSCDFEIACSWTISNPWTKIYWKRLQALDLFWIQTAM